MIDDYGDEPVEFDARVEHVTAKARLLEPTGIGPEQVWCPKSCIIEMSEADGEGIRHFTVKRWWAEKNGLT